MYRVVLTDSATDNDVAAARGGPGALLQYEDREAAAAAAERYSDDGDVPVRLQAPAPQDPRDVDAYLVANPERRVRRPTGSIDDGLAFETSASQYGALGEALLTSHEQDPPVLLAYARRTLDGDQDRDPAVQLETDPDPVTFRSQETGDTATWLPDCAATVTVGGAIERRLLCEVKTGNGSTERDQRRVMQWAASERDREVLLVRLDVEALPDEYTARIQEIEPQEPDREWIDDDADLTLGEFQ
ncbi:hypothetical protein [Salinarchaeum sp. Harcht-Bsk1]|uniref:hypothetical protein n=1 Tax=Salinarchaeum sp. Harcht-Bsk1 TaxID=1333523 RepID=UPI000677D3BE|nr:hypothetical protein [Salinarchaeum sp. Harcht-Bsk1]